ncbi:MAG TPA: hypothetical protein VHB21_11450 [Minicystis sp.]|nr:hypothetical protein [Minicystis sp.]
MNISSRPQRGMRHCLPTGRAPGMSPRAHSSTTVRRGSLSTAAASSGVSTGSPAFGMRRERASFLRTAARSSSSSSGTVSPSAPSGIGTSSPVTTSSASSSAA